MVNRGASRGCITCRQRHVKCDESKPWCKECLRLGHECAGYGRRAVRVRFRDETARYLGRPKDQETRASNDNQTTTTTMSRATTESKNIPSSASQYDYTILPSPPPLQQDLAVSFFLTYVTVVGRSLESSRGFLEFVSPVLATQRHDSALSTAVNALATKLWARLGHRGISASLQFQLLRRALIQLQKAIEDPEERSCDGTVLAALVLQQYDTLSAIFGQQKAHSTHRDGALALLSQRGDHRESSKYHAYLLGNLLHSKVSFCVREMVLLPLSELEWLETQVIPIVPINPSSLLDVIGITVAKLQYTFYKSSSAEEDSLPCGLGELSENIQTVDAQLQMWLEVVPQYWYPKRIRSENVIESSIEMYQGACDVYPSVQIASIWNSWRIYRLIIKLIKLQLASDFLTLARGQKTDTNKDECIDDIIDSARNTYEAQELIDSICYSIPFYLGNRTYPLNLSDMGNPQCIFPSYHDLQPNDEVFLTYQASDHYVSRVDHSRHVFLHGPVHIMSILSHLIRLVTKERSMVVSQILRQEQKHWISEQFLRSLYLLRLTSRSTLNKTSHDNSTVHSQQITNNVLEAQVLANKFRQGLLTMNIH